MSLFGVALSLAVAPTQPAIEGDTICPTPAEVAAELRPLLGSNAPSRAHVVLSSSSDALDLELRSASGERLAQRRLARVASCADLAAAAAVVIASWQSSAPPSPGAAIELARPSLRAPALRYDVGAAFVASLSPSFAPGALVDATLAPRSSRFGARLAAFGTATRDQPIGRGHASWTRAALLLGPRLRLTHQTWLFDLDAGVALALLYAGGVGLTDNRAAYNFDPGLTAGARVGVHWGVVAPTLGVAVLGWLRRQEIDVTGTTNTSLPQWEIVLTAGITVGVY